WLFSSSDTSARQKSDERISVGLNCLRANVDFPQPDGPIRTTSDNSGIVMVLIGWFLTQAQSLRKGTKRSAFLRTSLCLRVLFLPLCETVFHCFSNIAICVGAPTVSSSGQTGRNRTAYP